LFLQKVQKLAYVKKC